MKKNFHLIQPQVSCCFKEDAPVADWGYVLETGRVTLSGKASDLTQMDEVRAAYLGE